MKIVTSSARFIDIDAYAGCVAYAELLQKQGKPAQAVGEAMLNQSVPPVVREWQTDFNTVYTPSDDDTFTLIDISEPQYFEAFEDQSRIDEIIDHHAGFEEHWQEQIGDRAIIEHVGAACTLVYEKWEQSGILERMSQTSARLLMCGILDNTLHFGAKITTQRDRQAYEALSKIANLPEDWPARYFAACQAEIVRDLSQAVKDDSKTMHGLKTFANSITVGQLAIWDGPELAVQSFETFKHTLAADQPFWCMNLISIKDGRSYFVTDIPAVQTWLANLLGVTFEDNVVAADRMWLRKEMLKADVMTEAVL
jgi:inorganic pyrophosphatase